ncbi:CHAT domain-containing protein [Arthrobacter sp. P2b]|uniref:CHAT domain-containing protein n=1 Tax=Arthrobacter sp. P2b TaxID=1938741 RepID=UPI0009A8B6C0|nr:CHAT domain-containing protein [Arthrobacter sp. P2b]SLK00916.1 Tetratricopeptide repeat-containing protein [Arthrobacter sp. P2b]
MTNSSAERIEKQCPTCGATAVADVWLIVDESERPDLVRSLRDDVLHGVSCTNCGSDVGQIDAPVVLYRPQREPAVLFFPAKQTSAEEDHENAFFLLTKLRDALGDTWRDEWLQPLNSVSQEMARFILSEAAESLHPTEVGALFHTVLQFTNTKSWNDARALIQEHPALLSPLADVILAKLASDQPDPLARIHSDDDRAFLERCRAVGLDQALTERTGVDRAQLWPDELFETLRMFLDSPTWSGSRDVLEANSAVLLSPISDLAIARTMDGLTKDPAGLDFVSRHRQVLDLARRSGIDAAFEGLSGLKVAADQSYQMTKRQPSEVGGRVDGPSAIGQEQALLHHITKTDPDGLVAQAMKLLSRSRATDAINAADRVDVMDRARHLIDRDRLPMVWQAVTLAGAEALVYQSRADLTTSVEKAIALCEEVEQIADRDQSPKLWGLLRSIQGEAYRHRALGDRADNLERAIAYADQALQVRTLDAAPEQWTATEHNRGIAYLERVRGEHADNVETTITCLRRALQIRTRDRYPAAWADTQVVLGNAYLDRVHGSEAENVEQAIVCYGRALEAVGRQSEADIWAQGMHGLGIAYRSRIFGEPAENLAFAMNCLQQALQVWTHEDYPRNWAMAQMNLGNALQSALDHDGRQRIEEAIACYRNALQEYTRDRAPDRWAVVQINLATAWLDRIDGDSHDNRRLAVAALESAQTVYTRDAYPERWASIERNLAAAYTQDDETDESLAAVDHLRQALTVYTVDAFPAVHRMISGKLGGLHFDAGRFDEAHAVYNTAIAAGEAAYQASDTTIAGQTELAEFGQAVPNDAYCLAQSGRFAAAVERLEGGRARALAEALAFERVSMDAVVAGDRRALGAARERIRALESAARTAAMGPNNAGTGSFPGYVAALRAARGELAAVVDRIRGYVPDFMPVGTGIDVIATSAEPLVYIITTRRGSLALIVPPGVTNLDQSHCVWLDGFRSADLMQLLGIDLAPGSGKGYLVGQLTGEPETLRASLDRALPVLTTLLMSPLVKRLADLDIIQATVIAGGLLALLPLHAAVGDAVTLTYAPSALVQHAARGVAERRAGLPLRLVGVADPRPGPRALPFAHLEVTAIAASVHGTSPRLLSGKHATRAATMRAIVDATHLHFACHGLYKFDQPLASGLLLAGDQMLTLATLIDEVSLTNAKLAVLSACQTAITDMRHVPDEAIGLPAGFLQAGVPGVISSLWSVEDLSTALLMERFYQLHLNGDGGPPLQAASALQRAQCWLRDASAGELAERCQGITRITGMNHPFIYRTIRYFRAHPDDFPFAHPYYWAAFTFSGA